jgi:hypothetical protein
MDFPAWVATQPHGTLKRIEREYGAGYSTLHRLMNGGRLDSYDLAERISKATSGAVSIEELCRRPNADPAPPTA